MSPSSSLAAANTAAIWSRDFVAFVGLLRAADGQLDGSGLVPSSYSRSCFTIDVVRLRDLPPRVGFSKHDDEIVSSLDHLDDNDEFIRTALINFCSRFAAAGRAPFGILFRICHQAGWTRTTFSGGDDTGVGVVVISTCDDAIAVGRHLKLLLQMSRVAPRLWM